MLRRAGLAMALALVAGGGAVAAGSAQVAQPAPTTAPGARIDAVPYRVTAVHPHDSSAFTQGLIWYDGHLFESTGLEGQSDVRKVRLADGAVLARTPLPPSLFGEGIARWRDEIVSITWQSGIGFRWKIDGLRRASRFRFPSEGWGLAATDTELVLSDGTPELRFLDPVTFAEHRRLTVTANGRPLRNLNELEWIDGAVWGNVWMSNWIVRIDPATGIVTHAIDVAALTAEAGGDLHEATPNGIAWDPGTRRLFVTGKRWPKLFVLDIGAPIAP